MSDTVPIPPGVPPVFDFSKSVLAKDYTGFYMKVIDNVFTAEECAELIALAESDAKWEQAAVHYGLNPQDKYVDTSYRNSERILRFDHAAAEKIYKRLLPLVPELVEIKHGHKYERLVEGSRAYGNWKLVGINERLSFLRYGPGNFFNIHCDGRLSLPDGRKSRVTLQVYLNEDGLKGGTTRIWGTKRKNYIDVKPKLGRVLVFQQKGIWHTGEPVTEGVKYAVRSDFMFVDGPDEDDANMDLEADEVQAHKDSSERKGLLSEVKGFLGFMKT